MKIVIIVSCALIVLFEIWFRVKQKKEKSNIEDALTQALLKQNFKEFDRLIESEEAYKRIAPFNRLYMKLNASFMKDDEKEIESCVNSLLEVRMNQAQKDDFYSKVFGYYAQKENKERASYFRNLILKDCKKEGLHVMANRLYSIYIDKSDEFLQDLLMENESLQGPQKATNDVLIAQIYNNKSDFENEKKYLKLFEQDMKGE
ncbi:MAG: hypothetical protein ACI4UK_11685 [Floccifex sp.]